MWHINTRAETIVLAFKHAIDPGLSSTKQLATDNTMTSQLHTYCNISFQCNDPQTSVDCHTWPLILYKKQSCHDSRVHGVDLSIWPQCGKKYCSIGGCRISISKMKVLMPLCVISLCTTVPLPLPRMKPWLMWDYLLLWNGRRKREAVSVNVEAMEDSGPAML